MNEVFEKYLQLYSYGTSIKSVNPIDNQTFKVLVSSNVDIRIVDRDQHLAEIGTIDAMRHFSLDTEEYSSRFFYMIPLQTVKGTIVGFILRSVFGKKYHTITREFSNKDYKVPIMFGFYKDFADFDSYSICKPIIVCEGLKDCITLKKIYPYVLANNTSSMGINLQILSNLTDKFILVYDNDKAGQEGMNTDVKKILKSLDNVIKITPKECYKDCADCYENKEDFKEFSDRLRKAINDLESYNESNNILMTTRHLIKR